MRSGGNTCSIEQVEEEGALVILFHPNHLLGDVLGGGTHTPNSQKDVLLQKVTGQNLNNNRMCLYSFLLSKFVI